MKARPDTGPQPALARCPACNAHEWANTSKGPWRVAGAYILNTTLTKADWSSHGLQGFLDPYRRFPDATRTAGCGSARPVVWEGPE